MAMSWDASSHANDDAWYLFGNVRDFMEGVDLVNKMWRPQANEVGLGYPSNGNNNDIWDYTGGLIALTSVEPYPEAIGVIHNRTWNYYSKGDSIINLNENGDVISITPCGGGDGYEGLWGGGDPDPEDHSFEIFYTLSNTMTSGPYPLLLEHLTEDVINYSIHWYNPFTMELVDVQYKSASSNGIIVLDDYPVLGHDSLNSPCYLFKATPNLYKSNFIESKKDVVEMANYYPIPTFETLNIEIFSEMESSHKVLVYNNLGQIVLEKEINTKFCSLDLHLLNSGLYVIKIFNNSTKKLISTEKITKFR